MNIINVIQLTNSRCLSITSFEATEDGIKSAKCLFLELVADGSPSSDPTKIKEYEEDLYYRSECGCYTVEVQESVLR